MRVLKNKKGQTLVEFALIIALFLAILFGIVEFGRAWYYSNHLGNSVRAAARYGAVYADSGSVNYDVNTIIGTSSTGTTGYANREITGFMNATPGATTPGRFQVTVNIFPNNSTTPKGAGTFTKHGDTIQVIVRYNMQILTGSVIPFFNTSKMITRSASMPIE